MAERRAGVEVRDVGDIAAVLVAVKDVDVIVAQRSYFHAKIVSVDDLDHLTHLVRLRLSANFLHVERLDIAARDAFTQAGAGAVTGVARKPAGNDGGSAPESFRASDVARSTEGQ